MLPNEIPTADVLELQTVDYAQKVLAESIKYARGQGKFHCDIERSTYDICRKDLEQRGYYIEYNAPYGFRVHWNAEYIKRLKENKELIRAYREEGNRLRASSEAEVKQMVMSEKAPGTWYSPLIRLFN